jgi:hypothetical protein
MLLCGPEDERVIAEDFFRTTADGEVRGSAEEIAGNGVRTAATGRSDWTADAPWWAAVQARSAVAAPPRSPAMITAAASGRQ